jgi:hypothetical protein
MGQDEPKPIQQVIDYVEICVEGLASAALELKGRDLVPRQELRSAEMKISELEQKIRHYEYIMGDMKELVRSCSRPITLCLKDNIEALLAVLPAPHAKLIEKRLEEIRRTTWTGDGS